MKKDSILYVLKQTFKHIIPVQDKRTTLPHLEFVSGFIFCFLGDTKTPSLAIAGEEILGKLKVTSILLIDSSSITLWDGAQESFPGTRTVARIKWHACFNLLSGKMEWFSTLSTSVNDRKCFLNYVTNLEVCSSAIYSLYRIRW